MITTLDVDEAMLFARATVEQWEAEFQEAFNKPLLVAEVVQEFLTMPPEARAMVKEMDPELYALCNVRAQRLQDWVRPVAGATGGAGMSAEMGTGAVPPYQPVGPGQLAPTMMRS